MKQHADWDHDLPFEGRQRREVFARFGLASLQGQCVEKQLAMLVSSVCDSRFLSASAEQRELLWQAEADKTLGAMLKTLEQRNTAIPSGIHGRLRRALVVRNHLAHNFFAEADRAILSTDGRERLISELSEAADFLASVDAELTGIYENWMIARGITTRAGIEAAVEDYLRHPPTA